MGLDRKSIAEHRQNVLLVAHSFDANASMESRLSWLRANHAARHYDVTVLCVEPYARAACNDPGDNDPCDIHASAPGLEVVTVPHSVFEKLLIKTPGGFYLAYRLWHRRVLKTARQLHDRRNFAFVHQVSYCGYREPGYCWQLGIPFVWGPIGGTQNVPWRFLTQLGVLGALKEAVRTVANEIQLRLSRRVGKALRAASRVFVANREIQERFRKVQGVILPCQLETGVNHIIDQPRMLRDTERPLRVLWAGRLENWKALPLLLKAVAQLPSDFALELRIVGTGSQLPRLKRLARTLGIENRLDWVSLPPYGARDQYYHWADVFAFTSLRDTSGTGLLEALAAGTPIVGLNHQGAHDIMTDDCAIPIAVENPQQVINAFRSALMQLTDDPSLLHRLSEGAVLRAHKFHWQRLNAEMSETYSDLLKTLDALPPVRLSGQHVELQQTTPAAG